MADTGTDIIAIVIIFIFVLLGIALFIWATLISPLPPKIVMEEPDFDAIFLESLSDEWTDTSVGPCLKYTFVFPEQPTLDVEILDEMKGVPSKDECPLSDELSSEKVTSVCNQTTCTDTDGQMYVEGQSRTFYRQCVLNQGCEKTLTLIAFRYDPHSLTNRCVTQDGVDLRTDTCDQSDENQLFVIERLNTQFAKITNKDGQCIIKGSGSNLVMGPCSVNSFSWDLLNGKRYMVPPIDDDDDGLRFVPQQIVFWDQSTDATVPATDIILGDNVVMSIDPTNALNIALEDLSTFFVSDVTSQNSQLLDYPIYQSFIGVEVIPFPGVPVFPFYSNLPEVTLPAVPRLGDLPQGVLPNLSII